MRRELKSASLAALLWVGLPLSLIQAGLLIAFAQDVEFETSTDLAMGCTYIAVDYGTSELGANGLPEMKDAKVVTVDLDCIRSEYPNAELIVIGPP